MTDDAVRLFMATLPMTCKIAVTFIPTEEADVKSKVLPKTKTLKATFLGMSRDDDDDDDAPPSVYDIIYDKDSVKRHLPVPQDEILVLTLEKIDESSRLSGQGRLPQVYKEVYPPNTAPRVPDLVIYFDGGSKMHSKVTNMAVCAKLYVDGNIDVARNFTRKYDVGSNNCGEHLSLLGALRLARHAAQGKLHPTARIKNIAIVGDSEVAIHQFAAVKATRAPHLVALREAELRVKGQLAAEHSDVFVQLFHTYRRFNTDADKAGRDAERAGVWDDPLNLFEWDISLWPESLKERDDVDPAAATAAAAGAADAAAASSAAPGDAYDVRTSYTPDEICYLRTFPCLESVPLEAAQAWASIVHGQVATVLAAKTDKEMAGAFSRLLVLPCIYLPTHISTTKLIMSLHEKRPSVRKPATVERSVADEDSRRTRRALRYAHRGFLRQAAKCFRPVAVARVDEPVVQDLLKSKVKVSEGPVYGSGEKSPEEATGLLSLLPAVPSKLVRRCLKSMNPVAASGMDRWNSALVLAAIENSVGMLDLFARLLHLMLSRWKVFEPFCVLARGIALVKKVTDIRPIGIAGFFVKLLATVCLKLDDPARILPTWQYGMSSNGCYRVIRDVRARLDHPDTPSCLITVDAENAFNSISRQRCWDAIYARLRQLPFIAAFFRLTYSSPSVVHYQHSGNSFLTIRSDVGVRQGCPCSSFAYNLATADLLEPAIASIPPGCGFYALHDDITITAPTPDVAIEIFDRVKDRLASASLKVNAEKCEFVSPKTWLLGAGAQVAATRNLRYIHAATESVRILGAQVGAVATASAFVQKKLEETVSLLNTVSEALGFLEPRACLAILKYCCQPKLLYCFTTHHPDVTTAHAITYREALVTCIKNFLGSDIQEDLIFSSLGLSFIDYTPGLEILYKKFLNNSADLALSKDPLRDLRTAYDTSVLNKYITLKARVGGMGPGATGSMSWLSSFVPTVPVAQPSDVISLIRVLLHADPRAYEPCFCGTPDAGDGNFIQHILVCDRVCGATRVYRHNCILTALEHHLRLYGCFCSLEPRFYSYADGSKKRPDLTVHTTVPQPLSTDIVVSINMDEALKGKKEKHAAAVHDAGHAFMPIAMSIWGEHHASTDEFLQRALHHMPPKTKTLAIQRTKRAMSEGWLIGTAAMIRGVVQRDLSRLEMARLVDDDDLSPWAA